MVTMQVRSVATLQRRLRPCQMDRKYCRVYKKNYGAIGKQLVPPGQGQGHVFVCLSVTIHRPSSVNLDLPEGLLVGPGFAATSRDSPFRQAQNAAERSEVASPHRWSLMLPTSERVTQEVHEPLIGIQYPMLCSRMGDTQIGATSSERIT